MILIIKIITLLILLNMINQYSIKLYLLSSLKYKLILNHINIHIRHK